MLKIFLRVEWSMGSDAGWKVEGPRENITIITKIYFKNSSIVLQKSERAMAQCPPPSLAALWSLEGIEGNT